MLLQNRRQSTKKEKEKQAAPVKQFVYRLTAAWNRFGISNLVHSFQHFQNDT
jgi:hypothetical protein